MARLVVGPWSCGDAASSNLTCSHTGIKCQRVCCQRGRSTACSVQGLRTRAAHLVVRRSQRWHAVPDGGRGQVREDDAADLLRGTRITLHLKEDAVELADAAKLGVLVKQYSEFIQFPIKLWSTKTEYDQARACPFCALPQAAASTAGGRQPAQAHAASICSASQRHRVARPWGNAGGMPFHKVSLAVDHVASSRVPALTKGLPMFCACRHVPTH